jgi:hypothetical protein
VRRSSPALLDNLGRTPAEPFRYVVMIVKPTRLDVGLGALDSRLLRRGQGCGLVLFVLDHEPDCVLRHDATVA